MAVRRNGHRQGTASELERLHSVRRALAVLESLAARPEGATPKELSLALGLHLSTCYRLLNMLVAARYVAREADGLFRLGSRVAYLHHGYLKALRPPPEALPFVHALQLATGETSVLSQLESDEAVNTLMVAGNQPAAAPPGYVGLAAPAHAVATGRVLLAAFSTPQIEAYVARQAELPGAPFPLTDPDAFRAELERIRRNGYALDLAPNRNDVCCAAAPVLDPTGTVVAAIAVVAPRSRFLREESALVKAILTVTHALSALQAVAPAAGAPTAPRETEAGSRATSEAAIAEIAAATSRVRLTPRRRRLRARLTPPPASVATSR